MATEYPTNNRKTVDAILTELSLTGKSSETILTKLLRATATLSASVGTNGGDIGDLEQDVTTLQQDMTTAEGDIDDLEAAVNIGHRVVAAGLHSWAGGAATTDSIAVTGLGATDVVVASLAARSATETLVLAANDSGNEQIDLTLSANGADGVTKVNYVVLRPFTIA